MTRIPIDPSAIITGTGSSYDALHCTFKSVAASGRRRYDAPVKSVIDRGAN